MKREERQLRNKETLVILPARKDGTAPKPWQTQPPLIGTLATGLGRDPFYAKQGKGDESTPASAT